MVTTLDQLIGAKLHSIRALTSIECERSFGSGLEPGSSAVLVLELPNGHRVQVFASRDEEGNGPGTLMLVDWPMQANISCGRWLRDEVDS